MGRPKLAETQDVWPGPLLLKMELVSGRALLSRPNEVTGPHGFPFCPTGKEARGVLQGVMLRGDHAALLPSLGLSVASELHHVTVTKAESGCPTTGSELGGVGSLWGVLGLEFCSAPFPWQKVLRVDGPTDDRGNAGGFPRP